ncbi:MAG: DUF5119 domain-containing protein [Phocaeicola sp.]
MSKKIFSQERVSFRNRKQECKSISAYFLFSLFLLLVTTTSCHRRPLVDILPNQVVLPITVDWSLTGLDPDDDPDENLVSFSVWLFPDGGGKPQEFILYRCGGEIIVKVGTYQVLIFNNNQKDYRNLKFDSLHSWKNARAVARPHAIYSNRPGIIENPEILAAWSLEKLEVTPEMLRYTQALRNGESKGYTPSSELINRMNQLQNVKPERRVFDLKTVVHVKNLNSARSASARLYSTAAGTMLVGGEELKKERTEGEEVNDEKSSPVSQLYALANPTYYPTSGRHGTVEATVGTFGLFLKDLLPKYEFEMEFFLGSDKSQYKMIDITKTVCAIKPLETGEYQILLEIGSPESPAIELPESSGGMDVGFDDWGNIIDIPIDM